MRLSIEISAEQHQQIKAMAAMKGKSIKELVLGKVFNEKEGEAWEDLKAFLKERVSLAENTEPSIKSIDDIATEVIGRNPTL